MTGAPNTPLEHKMPNNTLKPQLPLRPHALPHVTLSLVALALVIFYIPGLTPLFELNLSSPWRMGGITLLTGHLTHWSENHLLWDGVTFAFLLGAHEFGTFRTLRPNLVRLAVTLVIAALLTSLYMVYFGGGYSTYRGLSGLCVCAFVFILDDLWSEGGASALLASAGLILLAAKLLFEHQTGVAVFAHTGATPFVVAVEAHIIGALVGLGSTQTAHKDVWRPCPSSQIC